MNIHDDPARSEETRMLLQAAIESANDAIIITELKLNSPGPRIEYVNPAFTRMTQYSQSEVVGQTPRVLQGPKTSRELLARLREDLKTGQSFHGETTNYRKDGTEYEVEWRITPVYNRAGEPIKWVAVQRDVTDRVRAEAALKASERHLRAANQDLEQFVFAASHDLQEPIRNVSLHSEYLTKHFRDALPEEMKEHFGYIREGSLRLGALIQDLLAYARVSNTSLPQPTPAVDVNRVVRSVCKDISTLIQESGCEIKTDELPTIRMHEIQLRQIYLNLLTNAIKYRKPEIKPEITLRSHPELNPGTVCLSVQDNGVGIDPRYHAEVFRVFRRLNPRDTSGTGIGLAIVQRIVEQYGGSIWVQSEEGKGTTIFFTADGGTSENDSPNQHPSG